MPDLSQRPKRIQAPKVMVIDFRPAAVPATWAKTDDLVREYVSTMLTASGGSLAFQVVIRKNLKDYPPLEDGRR